LQQVFTVIFSMTISLISLNAPLLNKSINLFKTNKLEEYQL